jgi:hypothetical protein
MIAALPQIAVCAAIALVLWTTVGYAVAIRIVPPVLAAGLAPMLGWAVHSALALPLFSTIGFSRPIVGAVAAASMVGAIAALGSPRRLRWSRRTMGFGVAIALAAILSLASMWALVPKFSGDEIALSWPIFDHAKIALIDEMVRLGVPPGNPVFGEDPNAPLAYYYLWHFSAAELASITGMGGWAADAGLTFFTAFGALSLMMGLAAWLAERAAAAVVVVVLAAAGSLRPALETIIGANAVDVAIGRQTGFAGWLMQVTWAPQHVAAACSVIIAIYFMAVLKRRPNALAAVALGLAAAAGFQSSTWIGGVTFPLAAIAVLVAALLHRDGNRRLYLMMVGGGAVIALACALPFLFDQWHAAVARDVTAPIKIAPYPVLGSAIAEALRRWLDLPAYWLVLLPIELSASYIAALALARRFARDQSFTLERRDVLIAVALLTGVGLCVGWLVASTLAYNNDLGWRAILPAVMALIAIAAGGLAKYGPTLPRAVLAGIALMVLLGLSGGAKIIRDNIVIEPGAPSAVFPQTVALWQAVRQVAGPSDRVANNPQFLGSMTAWPINISWALLSDRRSCFAGSESALVFAPLSRQRREAIDQMFSRVFAGAPGADDIGDLVRRYHCRVAVVTAQDGAWNNDPFAASALYDLVDERAGRWRIYRAREQNPS